MKVIIKRNAFGRTSVDVEIDRAEDKEQLNKGLKFYDDIAEKVNKYIQQRQAEIEAAKALTAKKKGAGRRVLDEDEDEDRTRTPQKMKKEA